ncbi:homocysteine S-methyltransferase [Mycolicibacter arupensis]|uniref:Homocysteine S-methyltransferase n=1 Tax=Mycolicibacter arupensis TaxID=342002 RepID=A0A5C7Y4D3_9MYCO|nr:homocysteine S-methyltransferase [Mycolicibacter arupensis]TXI56278.1 MAG: homocysteine S-methyltransferase [Mycolicibacter arupensis]
MRHTRGVTRWRGVSVSGALPGCERHPRSSRPTVAAVAFAVPDDTVLVADGGLATELEARGADLSDPLWSARLLIEAPEEVEAVHRAYFAAGAQIATTASYQASFEGFAARGVDAATAEGLLARSVRLARAATDDGPRRWVAASIGPYGASRADGSEYLGRYGLSVAQLSAWHRPRLEVLASAGADLLALETVPDVDEAEALVGLVRATGLPAWLSYTIAGTATRAGQSLDQAFAVATGVPQIVAVGVNCCDPDDVLPAIEIARAVTEKPVIVYPNSGERWTSGGWSGPARFSPALVPAWIAAGARIVGGCCRVGPADITAVAALRRTCTQRENPCGNSR